MVNVIVTLVYILNEAVSHSAYTLGKAMNLTIVPPVNGK